MKITQKKLNRKYIVAATVVVALFAFGWIAYFAWSSSGSQTKNGVDYSPATEADKEYNNDIKEDITKDAPTEQQTDNSGNETRSVVPVISAWGQAGGPGTELRINGYVPDIIEANGTCTITLSKGSETVTASKASLQNAQNTSCGQFVIPFNQLEVGTWQAVLSYKSEASAGSSVKTKIEVK